MNSQVKSTQKVIKVIEEKNELLRLNKILRTVSKINQLLVICKDEKELCTKICNVLDKIRGYKLTWIGLLDNKKSAIEPIAFAGDEKAFLKTIKKYWEKYNFNECPSGKAIKNGKPYVIRDLKSEERFVPWENEAIERGFLSSAILPLIVKEEVIGTLHIYSDIENDFPRKEVKFLNEVSRDISIGIKGIRNEKSLEESENRFRRLSESSMEGLVFHDNGIILDANQAAADMFGEELPALIGMNVFDFMLPESRILSASNVKKKYKDMYEVQFSRHGKIIDIESLASKPTFAARK